MKTLATIVLSVIAIGASLVLVLSTVCAFNGGILGSSDRSSYVLCAIISFAIVAAAMCDDQPVKPQGLDFQS